MKKLVIISAPSGAGKTSIVHYLLNTIPQLSFSISACSRKKRTAEINGKDYYFLSVEEFKNKISNGAFLEWEEVYENQFYGTLKSELTRISSAGKTTIFDVDVVGGLNIKELYPQESLAIFIMPPSLSVLKKRLSKRGSENEESLIARLEIAEQEIARHNEFDAIILNDDFNIACEEAKQVVTNFITS